jgi:hypothetical protein
MVAKAGHFYLDSANRLSLLNCEFKPYNTAIRMKLLTDFGYFTRPDKIRTNALYLLLYSNSLARIMVADVTFSFHEEYSSELAN